MQGARTCIQTSARRAIHPTRTACPTRSCRPGIQFVNIAFQYASESDPGPYPFGPDTPIEGGQNSTGDRHALMVDPGTCTLYELYDAHYNASGSTAGSGAIWNLNSNALAARGVDLGRRRRSPYPARPRPLRRSRSGSITHAIRMTAETTDTSYLWPARHEAGARSDPNLPPMGARFRLKAELQHQRILPTGPGRAAGHAAVRTHRRRQRLATGTSEARPTRRGPCPSSTS